MLIFYEIEFEMLFISPYGQIHTDRYVVSF